MGNGLESFDNLRYNNDTKLLYKRGGNNGTQAARIFFLFFAVLRNWLAV